METKLIDLEQENKNLKEKIEKITNEKNEIQNSNEELNKKI